MALVHGCRTGCSLFLPFTTTFLVFVWFMALSSRRLRHDPERRRSANWGVDFLRLPRQRKCRDGLGHAVTGCEQEVADHRLLLDSLEVRLVAVHALRPPGLHPFDGETAATAVGTVAAAGARILRGGAKHAVVVFLDETALHMPDTPLRVAEKAGALVNDTVRVDREAVVVVELAWPDHIDGMGLKPLAQDLVLHRHVKS